MDRRYIAKRNEYISPRQGIARFEIYDTLSGDKVWAGEWGGDCTKELKRLNEEQEK